MPPSHRPKQRAERPDHGWVISFGCKPAGVLRRLKVSTDPASDTRPIDIPCVCGEVHQRVTVSPYRRRRSSDEPYDLEVVSLDELRSDS